MHDSATVTGSKGTPTGSVTFFFYTTIDGTDTPIGAGTVQLDANGVANPSDAQGPLPPGSYSFRAHYNGDTTYLPSDSPVEPLTISKATPSIVTTVSAGSVTVGATISDSATVSGGFGDLDDGTVTFNLYDNPNGTGTPLFTSANRSLVNGVATSTSYTTAAVGTVYWVATYNGDSDNKSVSSGLTDEAVAVKRLNGGLTPGFWSANADNWKASAWNYTSYKTTTQLKDVFNLGSFGGLVGNTTFQKALDNYNSAGSTVNDAAKKLLWEAVAALLNASYNYNGTTLKYPLSTSQIVTMVNSALQSNNRTTILALATLLDTDNNLGFGSGITQKTGKPAA